MVARLKLKGIDGRAPPGVDPDLESRIRDLGGSNPDPDPESRIRDPGGSKPDPIKKMQMVP